MQNKTALIVPAMTEMAGQCRIVMRDGATTQALRDYRENPDAWKEVGIMNSRGKLVCLEDIPALREELQACEPLMAGLTFSWQEQGAA